MVQANRSHKPITGVVVFSEDNWEEKYSLESRSYAMSSEGKLFNPNLIGTCTFASNLDGTDVCIRIDYYIDDWKVDYCYIKNDSDNGSKKN